MLPAKFRRHVIAPRTAPPSTRNAPPSAVTAVLSAKVTLASVRFARVAAPLLSAESLEAMVTRERAPWYLSAYATAMALASFLVAFCDVAHDAAHSDKGGVVQAIASRAVGPRQKRVLLALALLSWNASILFVVELFLEGRRGLGGGAAALLFASVAGGAAYYVSRVREAYYLDCEAYDAQPRVHLAFELMVPFDLELVPLLPWSLDAAAPRDADGFPSASVARASLVALLLRSVPELIFAVVSIARSERLEITAAMNVVLTVADLAKVLVARCAFRPSGCIARRVHRRSPPATKIPERGRGADAARAEYVDVHRRITKHRVHLPVTVDDPPGFPVGPDAFDFELDDGPTPPLYLGVTRLN